MNYLLSTQWSSILSQALNLRILFICLQICCEASFKHPHLQLSLQQETLLDKNEDKRINTKIGNFYQKNFFQ